MKSILLVTVLAVGLPTQAPQVETITAVRYEFGIEGVKARNRFDSETNVLVKDMVCMDTPPKKTHLRLSLDDYRRILAVADEVKFFELPESLPTSGPFVEPNSHWRLWIRTNLRSHVVSWNDASDEESERAARVGRAIWDAISATDAYKRLPKPKCAYL